MAEQLSSWLARNVTDREGRDACPQGSVPTTSSRASIEPYKVMSPAQDKQVKQPLPLRYERVVTTVETRSV